MFISIQKKCSTLFSTLITKRLTEDKNSFVLKSVFHYFSPSTNYFRTAMSSRENESSFSFSKKKIKTKTNPKQNNKEQNKI